MNSVSRGTTNSSPQCFGQASVSSDSDPSEPVSVSSVGSVESVRDRSHLFLNPLKKRNSTTSDLLSSPVISKELQDLLNNFVSPAGIRQNSLQALAAVAQQRIQQNFASGILETPTPTKLLYPNSVTEEQERFAKGFTEALRQIQQQNQFVTTPTLQSPNAASLILPLLAALTPTLNAAPTFPLPSSLSSPISASTPTKPAIASLGTPTSTVPPTNVVSGSALSAVQLPIVNATNNNNDKSPSQSSGSGSTSGAQLSPLEELYKKLDPNNPHNFMDMFHHTDLTSSFQPFMNPALFHQTSALANTLPHHPTMPLQNHNQAHHQPPVSNIPGPILNIKTEPMLHNENSGYTNGMNSTALNCPTTSNHLNAYPSDHTFNPDEQERKKLERKRARNRMAASKCRQRKLERIQELEGLVQQEKQRTATFQQDIETLQKTVRQLSEQIERHRQAGCPIPPHHPTFKMPNL
uniref:BZIP domain-containing protein n=1 Tax=Acrobeloides nanus TaxID=290746 RepID=A0A914D960_9BILA